MDFFKIHLYKEFKEFVSPPSAFLKQAMQCDLTELAFLFVQFYSQMGFGGITFCS